VKELIANGPLSFQRLFSAKPFHRRDAAERGGNAEKELSSRKIFF